MFTVFKYEWKASLKNLLIWSLSVGIMGMICIILYQSMEETMGEMANSFSSMGAFSDAFGMSTLSIATLAGYFATEVGTIHALGSSIFAATLATVILSKEEEGHTAEFTYTLPLVRTKIVISKVLACLFQLVMFTIICAVFYLMGFMVIGEEIPQKEMLTFLLTQLLMNVEISAVCLFISAISKRNRLGMGIGVALMLYLYDICARVVPKGKEYLFVSPFSYSNASEIFAGLDKKPEAFVVGAIVIVLAAVGAMVLYGKKDLS